MSMTDSPVLPFIDYNDGSCLAIVKSGHMIYTFDVYSNGREFYYTETDTQSCLSVSLKMYISDTFSGSMAHAKQAVSNLSANIMR